MSDPTAALHSQGRLLLDTLRAQGQQGVTPLQALEWLGCLRLAAVVHRLRAEGYDIRTEIIETHTGKRVARYTLHEPQGWEQTGMGLL